VGPRERLADRGEAERASRTREAQRETLGLTEMFELLERHTRNLGIDDDST
jgi:hypothetical protein